MSHERTPIEAKEDSILSLLMATSTRAIEKAKARGYTCIYRHRDGTYELSNVVRTFGEVGAGAILDSSMATEIMAEALADGQSFDALDDDLIAARAQFAAAQKQLEAVQEALRWRDVATEPPPRDPQQHYDLSIETLIRSKVPSVRYIVARYSFLDRVWFKGDGTEYTEFHYTEWRPIEPTALAPTTTAEEAGGGNER